MRGWGKSQGIQGPIALGVGGGDRLGQPPRCPLFWWLDLVARSGGYSVAVLCRTARFSAILFLKPVSIP